MKHSMKLQYCDIYLGQIGYIALFLLNYWFSCLNIKSDDPVNKSTRQMNYLKECKSFTLIGPDSSGDK